MYSLYTFLLKNPSNLYAKIKTKLWSDTMRPKARWLAQHGGPSGWLEESDPAGVIFYMMDGP